MAQPTTNQNKIAQRAFEIYKSRGSEPGKDKDDWLQAEKELTGDNGHVSVQSFGKQKNRNFRN